MKFRETRFDPGGRVVFALIAVAMLVVVVAIVMRLTRESGLT